MGRPLVHRLAAKFLVGDGCWPWTGAKNTEGYGNFWNGARTVRAHRAVYEFFVGPISEGLTLDHLCRNTSCVRPDHLEPVTQAENMRRGDVLVRRKAAASAKTACVNGHDFDEQNTYINGHGHRSCRTCRGVHREKHRQKQ